jgi:hypothetical protein
MVFATSIGTSRCRFGRVAGSSNNEKICDLTLVPDHLN